MNKLYFQTFLVGVVCGSAGVIIGGVITKKSIGKRLEAEYEERLQAEIEATKRFIKGTYKDDISTYTAKRLQEAYGPSESDDILASDEDLDVPDGIEEEFAPIPVEKPAIQEDVEEVETTDKPTYKLEPEEYFENLEGWTERECIWFTVDETLAFAGGQAINNVGVYLGDDFHLYFEELEDPSEDDTIYIANPNRKEMYEIVLEEGKYSDFFAEENELKHNAHYKKPVMKFRQADE